MITRHFKVQWGHFKYTTRLASTALACLEVESFLKSSTMIGHLPQLLQGVHDVGAQFLMHL